MKKPKQKLKHDRPFQVRMTAELVDMIQGAANLAGLTASGWARMKLVEAAREEYKKAGQEPPKAKP